MLGVSSFALNNGLSCFLIRGFICSLLNVLFEFVSLSCLISYWFVKVKHNHESQILDSALMTFEEKNKKRRAAFQTNCSLAFFYCYSIWQYNWQSWSVSGKRVSHWMGHLHIYTPDTSVLMEEDQAWDVCTVALWYRI